MFLHLFFFIYRSKGVWTDAEGNEVSYVKWKSGEPNGDDGENAAVMYCNSNNDWVDVTVENTYYYVCKAAVGKSRSMIETIIICLENFSL